MDKSKKVYVAGTRDRLFVSQNLDKNQWLLVDKRGNVYENSSSADDIIKHIDKFVEQGKYILK
jgi:hypothetical protein